MMAAMETRDRAEEYCYRREEGDRKNGDSCKIIRIYINCSPAGLARQTRQPSDAVEQNRSSAAFATSQGPTLLPIPYQQYRSAYNASARATHCSTFVPRQKLSSSVIAHDCCVGHCSVSETLHRQQQCVVPYHLWLQIRSVHNMLMHTDNSRLQNANLRQ
jgi:hypothetical protein